MKTDLVSFCFSHPFQLDRSTREVELGLEYGPPVMNIGGQSWKFEDGQWLTGNDFDHVEYTSVQWLCLLSAEKFILSLLLCALPYLLDDCLPPNVPTQH